MKKLTMLFLCMSLLSMAVVGCGSGEKDAAPAENQKTEDAELETAQDAEPETAQDAEPDAADSSEELLTGLHHVEVEVADYGTIALELDADTAPPHRHQFYQSCQ